MLTILKQIKTYRWENVESFQHLPESQTDLELARIAWLAFLVDEMKFTHLSRHGKNPSSSSLNDWEQSIAYALNNPTKRTMKDGEGGTWTLCEYFDEIDSID